jgi:hypothetical protein
MKRWQLWVRVSSTQTVHTVIYASNAIEAKLIGEAHYGNGNVLNYTEIGD